MWLCPSLFCIFTTKGKAKNWEPSTDKKNIISVKYQPSSFGKTGSMFRRVSLHHLVTNLPSHTIIILEKIYKKSKEYKKMQSLKYCVDVMVLVFLQGLVAVQWSSAPPHHTTPASTGVLRNMHRHHHTRQRGTTSYSLTLCLSMVPANCTGECDCARKLPVVPVTY